MQVYRLSNIALKMLTEADTASETSFISSRTISQTLDDVHIDSLINETIKYAKCVRIFTK